MERNTLFAAQFQITKKLTKTKKLKRKPKISTKQHPILFVGFKSLSLISFY